MAEDTIIQWLAETKDDRLDKLLVARVPERSRSVLQKLIEDGLVTVNGRTGQTELPDEGGRCDLRAHPSRRTTR